MLAKQGKKITFLLNPSDSFICPWIKKGVIYEANYDRFAYCFDFDNHSSLQYLY